jgi:hypothetical protein
VSKGIRSGYVQEQAVATLAMVADASETTFAKVRFSYFRNGNLTREMEEIALEDMVKMLGLFDFPSTSIRAIRC